MLKETYKANVRNIPKDAIIIEVTRTKGHLLSPSWDLLNDYKQNKITWDIYVNRFKNEMNNDSCKRIMKIIKNKSKEQDVYLVCYEKNPPCHRFILMELINQME